MKTNQQNIETFDFRTPREIRQAISDLRACLLRQYNRSYFDKGNILIVKLIKDPAGNCHATELRGYETAWMFVRGLELASNQLMQ